ncbi:DUF7319 domain-containing protein [Halococcus saccharolyticus]|uniref:DUF7319 domain-containing protein n=1 Tax=Halococcus saccharolyticus DSM 5350 TaxID=1227455 RepID=M0MNZ1_9EURY|nr:hypothetical protein [Halococcus saccharolyticus]EMA46165.1 hypothetical protein C449_05652 [Halococcus saccharolyticus DSM 5350]
MADPRSSSSSDDGTADASDRPADRAEASDDETAELRRQVEETYDFEEFGPRDMAEMSPEEWDAAFDEEAWITGTELLDRVESDLLSRVADREVFARIERVDDGLLAYSDEGYAHVAPDGSVEGRGTVLRDVKPTVALCSMDDYDVPKPPDGDPLPDPATVPEGGGELGNWMLQTVAAAQLLVGLGLIGAYLVLSSVSTIAAPVLGLLFVVFSLLLFLQVANARLSDKFRAEEYRDRLRAVGVGSGERPDVLPEKYRDADGGQPAGAIADTEADEERSQGADGRDAEDSRPSA